MKRAGRSGMPFVDNPSPAHVLAVETPRGPVRSAFQIVATDVKRVSRRHAEQQSSACGFTSTSSNWLCVWASDRPGNTSSRNQPAHGALSRHTPVRNLMNCAGIKAVGKDDWLYGTSASAGR